VTSDDTELQQITVIVVAHGPGTELPAALEALEGRAPVVVIDNDSSAATEKASLDAGAVYVDSGRNRGFAAAVNLGLARIPDRDADVLLLNPDARLSLSGLDRLHGELRRRPDLACVAPVQRTPGGAPARAHWPWHTPWSAWAEAIGFAGHRLRSERYFLGGAVLLIRRAAWVDVGPFDERFFVYSEDEDWEKRAVAKGWRVWLCPEVTAVHTSGGTQSDVSRQQLLLHGSLERYVRKWYGPRGWAVYRSGTLVGLTMRTLVQRGTRGDTARRLTRMYVVGPERAAIRAGVLEAAG
jgi:GT2 family glycosyltransferase